MGRAWLAAAAVLLALTAVGLWTVLYQLVRQQGRLLLRLDAIDQRLGALAEQVAEQRAAVPPAAAARAPAGTPPPTRGVPVGAPLPAFSLADLEGRAVSLDDLRGAPALLVHWGPGCGFCEHIAPDLAALHPELARRGVRLALVAHGDAAANRALAERHGLSCPILLQPSGQTIEAFQTFGTPVAYLVDARGRVAAPVAIGADAVPVLARRALDMDPPSDAGRNGADGHAPRQEAGRDAAHTALPGMRPLSESRIPRHGLPPGTPAPSFSLPDLDGRTVSLEAYRGREVLLVLSDPNCGPCDELAPHLARLHRAHAEGRVALVMVGRGDPAENRRKARAHGMRFPVVLQRQWELSKAYGIFATPAAFLVGADGAIAREVAVGADAILELADEVLAAPAELAAGR